MLNHLLTLILPVILLLTGCATAPVEEAKQRTAPTQTLVLFSPTSVTGESIRDETIRRIGQTAHTLDVAMYGFNEPTLAEAIIQAKGRGVAIRIILDSLQAGGSTSQADEPKAEGLPVRELQLDRQCQMQLGKFRRYSGSDGSAPLLSGI